MESHVDTRENAPTDDTAHFSRCWPFMALRFVFNRSPYPTGVSLEKSNASVDR